MNIEFRPLGKDDYSAFLKLYEGSFPPEERRIYRDTADFEGFIESHKALFHPIGIYADGRFAGFLTYWQFDGYIYGEHAAIQPNLRGSGVGSRLFRYLFEHVSGNMLLEVEPTEMSPIAARRIGFYERLGFRLRNDIDYMQPPYAPGLPEVRLNLMTRGDFTPDIPLLKSLVYGWE